MHDQMQNNDIYLIVQEIFVKVEIFLNFTRLSP